MTRKFRAPAVSRWTPAALALYAIAVGSALAAPPGELETLINVQGADYYRTVKSFDFNERPLGNYEDTPMFWQRLTGEGLPDYSVAKFDDQVGHLAPPAFRFTILGGSVAYEYSHTDLAIAPDSDYLIEAYIRPEGLEQAAALLACYRVDQAGRHIPDSDSVSELVRSRGPEGSEGWQRVEIPLRGEFPAAHTLRLQLWVLQNHVFEEPNETDVAPIVRQEVDARVWFDDVRVIRRPRLRLWLSNPGGIIKPGAVEYCHLDVHNATLAPLWAELEIVSESGEQLLSEGAEIGAHETEEVRIAVPTLPPGMYEARARLGRGNDELAQRDIRFAVLPELEHQSARDPSLGVVIGPWPDSEPAGVWELCKALGCGAVKIGLPMIGNPRDRRDVEYLRQLRDLAHGLILDRIDAAGVILAPGVEGSDQRPATSHMVTTDELWTSQAAPVLAQLGGQFTAWQLGDEARELRHSVGWNATAVEAVRAELDRLVAFPQTVVPRSVLDAPPTDILADEGPETEGEPAWESLPRAQQPHAYSLWIPGDLPTRSLPWHMAFWFAAPGVTTEASADSDQHGPARWLTLGLDRDEHLSQTDRLIDMARRVVLARAMAPDRLYVPAPFEAAVGGGEVVWQPTDEFIPLRTLMHYLGNYKPVASLALADDVVAVLFARGSRRLLVLWTWRVEDTGAMIDLYLGGVATAVNLFGESQPLTFDGPVARVPLSPMPLIIENVDAALLRLQDSFSVSPTSLQLHDPEPRPVLRLTNFYSTELAGTAELEAPFGWEVRPRLIQLELGAGETLAVPLEFTIPPRQLATERTLTVDVHIRRPDALELSLEVGLQVALRDISVQSRAWWDGDTLVIEQALLNNSPDPVSFSAFCQPLDRPRVEGAFLNVAPGATDKQLYHLPAARDLANSRLWVGIEEIDGRRTLNQLVAVPD